MRRQSVLAAVFVLIAFAIGLAAQQAPPAPQKAMPQQAPPVFRSDANFVQVDAYPMKDGRLVTNLEKGDFEVFEDGKPQKVETFELIKVDRFIPDAEKRDPNTQEEGNELAADPKNRVFVVYLDTLHVSIEGAHASRTPLVQTLNRIMGPTDLFGVMTPDMRVKDLVFGRKVLTTEDMLARNWPWGMRDTIKRTPDEELLNDCTIDPNTKKEMLIRDGAVYRRMIDELIDRSREDRVLTHLEGLIDYLGAVRETRKSLIVFTEGWLLYEENEAFIAPMAMKADTPVSVIDNNGKIRQGSNSNYGSRASCVSEVQRLARLKDQFRFRQLVEKAKRANVVFYPINPKGMVAFDYPISQEVYSADGSLSVLSQDQDRIRGRENSMIDVANNTGGMAVVNTNNLNAGLERIANQLSAYYVLGYYSSNSKFDGKYREIDVKVKQPGMSVTARKGYRAPTEAEMAGRNAPKPTAAVAATVDASAAELAEALGTLSRIRPNSDLYGYGVQTSPTEVTVFAEVSPQLAEAGKWMDGGVLEVVLTSPAGATVATGKGALDKISRGASARIALPAGAVGPWNARLKILNAGDMLDTSVPIARAAPPSSTVLLGGALLYRATPGMRSALHPVADLLFRRTERLHVEWNLGAALETREARLLDRAGNPLPLQVTLGERPGVLAADVILAPLGPGDYILELTVSGGGATARTKIAIRVQN